MGRIIGFKDFPNAWEGPAILEFELYSEHTRTARYRSYLQQQRFDIYVPLFMLGINNKLPDRILVALGKSAEPLRTIGFRGEPLKPKVTSDIIEFNFVEEKANSVKYNLFFAGQSYNLYIPNEVFADELPPPRVYLQIGVPE